MSSGPTRVASRALARALSRPLHTSGANDKAAHALNLAPAAALPPAASSASAVYSTRSSVITSHSVRCEARDIACVGARSARRAAVGAHKSGVACSGGHAQKRGM